MKEEEENVALASKGWQKQKHKDILKVKCFRCGEMGQFASQCPLKQNDKDEKHDPKVETMKIDEEVYAMSSHASPGGRWGDIELYTMRDMGQNP